MEILQVLAGTLIIVPILVFIIVFAVLRRWLGKRAFGIAADVTTLVLFFSIPISIEAIWGISIGIWLVYGAILLAIGLLFLERKRTKELKISTYLRKTWRILFLLLSIIYAAVWIGGLIFMIIRFV
ncbi:DUF3397 family protein [Planomicrobium sp. YIM 101495]|uniref:DUF3397 family protein n=1 Tax=Planomicrobium sp. YIM 101495 TaxID=2665160 RepID=UPI0012B9C87F|nr:DUF3397 family protein [Planomicrobium sp. YIM 101495]MTD30335.1 DUF3397 family protein [Planomicrobium sp. YIM 101495]